MMQHHDHENHQRHDHGALAGCGDDRDQGAIFILTLLLTIVLSVVVLAIATFATTGLATSNVTTERSESNAVTSAGVTWFLEELTAKRIAPDDVAWCDDPGVTNNVPAGTLGVSGSTASVTCTLVPDIGGHPTVRLTANGATADGTDRLINAVVQVPMFDYTTQIRSWTVE